MSTGAPRPRPADFPWYLAGAGSWLGAMTLQTFLVQWLLVFELEVDAWRFGISRALMEVPPLAMLLVGGVVADRVDTRRLLLILSVAACLPPLAMAATVGHFGYWAVIAFGVVMALAQAASDPGRVAMMNRVTRIDMQRTVTTATAVSMLIALGAVWLGGRVETLGLANVLAAQAALFAASAVAVSRLPASTPPPASASGLRAIGDLVDGIQTLWRASLVRDVIGMNFVSALFNAGAYFVVMPLVVREIYAGDAAFLAGMFIAFTVGSTGANFALLLVMPLRRPGRVFLAMQLTRIAILAGLWCEPPAWLFFALILCWGVNMGVTATLVRTTVQELAPAAHRARILSMLLASFAVASPASALILGLVVDASCSIDGLLPGVAVSLAIYLYGRFATGLWAFESPSAHRGAGKRRS